MADAFPTHPTRIIIADDNSTIRHALRDSLSQRRDFALIGEAANGLEALQLIDQLHPDVLVLDLSMPVMDGFAVIEAVQAQALPVRIIVLSAHPPAEFNQKELVSGAVRAYLSKAERIERLVEAIRMSVIRPQ